MDHEALRQRIAALPGGDLSFVPSAFEWVETGAPSPVLIALIPQQDGTVLATRGDLRMSVEPVRNADGSVRVFANEADACGWAWEELRTSLTDRPSYTPEQRAAAESTGDAQRARIARLLEEHGH